MERLKQTIILFDLDGTLTDSAEGVLRSAQHMQKKMGMRVWSQEELRFMVGPPLRDTFRDVFHMNPEEVEQAILYFRERYFTVGLFENKVFPGIEEMLKELKAMGKRLGVATSKHESTAVRILEHFGIAQYFEVIGGDSPESSRTNKTMVMDYVLKKMGAKEGDAIMVGDRMFDIDGAHELGIPAIVVEFGYGDREEFEAHHADYIVKTPKEVADLFR